MLKPVEWRDNKLFLIDQRKLPNEHKYFECKSLNDVCFAITNMVVRGAPAIGVVTAFGVFFGLKEGKDFGIISDKLLKTRPTANSIKYVLSMMSKIRSAERALTFSLELLLADIERNKKIGFYGKNLIKNNYRIITHCNAGSLATAGYGTALGVLKAAKDDGTLFYVYVDETRPFFQGSRLTAYELLYEKIDFTIICDSAASFIMKTKKIDLAIVGADRIASNGDVINKIGTYSLAIAAREHKVPFYVAAPTYTFDFTIDNGFDVPIEYRDPAEIKNIGEYHIAPVKADALNPSFDVTPSKFVSGYITEKGIYSINEIKNIMGSYDNF
ncbi:MAG: S-methyl-5-thioribose-1-phosphate isomerase [Deferribacterota bacterium]|nr:S-methyl-5-thioribose-1-phosphate isomerase [Deferribacterota bacterium]